MKYILSQRYLVGTRRILLKKEKQMEKYIITVKEDNRILAMGKEPEE